MISINRKYKIESGCQKGFNKENQPHISWYIMCKKYQNNFTEVSYVSSLINRGLQAKLS